jgi:serine O-acetyltransferase
MICTLDSKDLTRFINGLLNNHLPDGHGDLVSTDLIKDALERVEYSFHRIKRKYYRKDNLPRFDHLNGDHMAVFLYYLSNLVWRKSGDENLATKISYLNKIMHGLDLFYSVPMPDIFFLVHPIGTVIGKANFSDYLVIYQNCTIGGNIDLVYPSLGEGVVLYSGTSVIGDCPVGDNVIFGANAFLINTAVPSNTLVVGQYPSQRMLQNRRYVREQIFGLVN